MSRKLAVMGGRVKPIIPHISEQLIRARASHQSFERGLSYYRRGAIYSRVQHGNTLEALCQGSESEPYRVRVTFSHTDITSTSCTCAYNWGGDCKHIVAVLLAWVKEPESFTGRLSIDEILEQKSKDELLALIKLLLGHDPTLESLLHLDLPTRNPAVPRPPVDPDHYRRHFRAILGRHEGWDTLHTTASRLSHLIGIGWDFLEAGDRPNATRVFEAIIDEGLKVYPSVYDDDGIISGELTNAIDGLLYCVSATPSEDSEHMRLIQVLWGMFKWEVESGGYGITDEVKVALLEMTTPAERRWLREQGEAALAALDEPPLSGLPAHDLHQYRRCGYADFLLDLEEREGDIDTFLKRARAQRRYNRLFDKLLELGRIREAVEIASVHFVGRALVKAADALVRAGHIEQAIALIEDAYWQQPADHLAEWLVGAYKMQGAADKALRLQRQRFSEQPRLELLQDIIALTPEHERDAVRAQLLTDLHQQQEWALLVRFYMAEKAWPEAWAALDSLRSQPTARSYRAPAVVQYTSDYLAVQLALASQTAFPHRAAEVYLAQARHLIALRGRDNYREAAIYLQEARRLYYEMSRATDWQTIISGIKEQNKTLRALQDELTEAGL